MNDLQLCIEKWLLNIKPILLTRLEIEARLNTCLPPHIIPLRNQVAGHINGIFKDTLLGRILKPIIDNRGCREKKFYEFIFHGPLRDNPCIRTLRSFLPFYHTTISLNDIQFIVLEDVSSSNDSGFSLMDVKLGKCAYDRHASIEKIKADGNKSKLSKTYGFRILGIKSWNEPLHEYVNLDRQYCKQLLEPELQNTFEFFLQNAKHSQFYEKVISQFIEQLQAIFCWFEQQNVNAFEFISSSLLLLHRGTEVKVKMIDFAHVYPLRGSTINCNQKLDCNYLFGLRNLISMFEQILVSQSNLDCKS